jgi:hypothetical protein
LGTLWAILLKKTRRTTILEAPKIALIHATPLAMGPISNAFKVFAPDAETFHLLDDSLSKDHAKAKTLTKEMYARFEDLTQYALKTGAKGILFTCSAFGMAIDECARKHAVPILKPNEAMFEEALSMSHAPLHLSVLLVATFEASIASMKEEFLALAKSKEIKVDFNGLFVPEAMSDLANGQALLHHQKIALALLSAPPCDVIMLAQFSMADAQNLCQSKTSIPILTSPTSAVKAIMQKLSQ